jgi:hypothetical protein
MIATHPKVPTKKRWIDLFWEVEFQMNLQKKTTINITKHLGH